MGWSNTFASLKESNKLEVKAAREGLPRSLWETYSAFANTDGGTILLGVEEDSDGVLSVCGVNEPESLVKTLWDGLNNPSCVSVNLLTDNDVTIDVDAGASYIVIEVPRAPRQDRPVYIRNNLASGSFRRNGEGDYHCTSEELKALVRDGGDEIDRLVLEEFELGSLCEETVASYRNAFQALRQNHPWNRLADSDFLMRIGAIGRGGRTHQLHPTRAGLLMFGYEYEITREYPSYLLDYRTRLGDRRWDDRIASMDGTWSGNVYDFWRKVYMKVVEGLPKPFALGPNMRRLEDTPMHAALREGLANMLVHADYYGRRGCVALREPGRITFSNPGSLRMSCDVALQGGTSDPRNATLMRMFSLVGIGERIGSGFDVMRAACTWAELPQPMLEESYNPDGTTLTFCTKSDDGETTRASAGGSMSAERDSGSCLDGPVDCSMSVGCESGSRLDRPVDMATARILDAWEQAGHGRSINAAPSSVAATLQTADGDSLTARHGSSDSLVAPSEVAVGAKQLKRRRLPREERNLVMHFVIENGEIRRIEAQELLGIGSTKAKALLNDMVTQGLLTVEGAGPSTRYLSASA